jgi:hypothetical protein
MFKRCLYGGRHSATVAKLVGCEVSVVQRVNRGHVGPASVTARPQPPRSCVIGAFGRNDTAIAST